MEYKIYYTGSKGNSNLLTIDGKRFMIDCGVPMSWLTKTDMLDKSIDFLLITHKHSDHIRVSTYDALIKRYPKMKVITNYEVAEFIKQKGSENVPHFIIDSGMSMKIGSLEINFIENLHGVETQGFIFVKNNVHLLYATDLSSTAFYEDFLTKRDQKIDICLLENNYDIEKLKESLEHHTGYDKTNAQTRHLEHEDFYTFINAFCKHPDDVVELHMSESLY